MNWTQTKTFSREILDGDDDFVNNLPELCKLNMKTLALEPLMHLCRRGCCAEASSLVNGSAWQKMCLSQSQFSSADLWALQLVNQEVPLIRRKTVTGEGIYFVFLVKVHVYSALAAVQVLWLSLPELEVRNGAGNQNVLS